MPYTIIHLARQPQYAEATGDLIGRPAAMLRIIEQDKRGQFFNLGGNYIQYHIRRLGERHWVAVTAGSLVCDPKVFDTETQAHEYVRGFNREVLLW